MNRMLPRLWDISDFARSELMGSTAAQIAHVREDGAVWPCPRKELLLVASVLAHELHLDLAELWKGMRDWEYDTPLHGEGPFCQENRSETKLLR